MKEAIKLSLLDMQAQSTSSTQRENITNQNYSAESDVSGNEYSEQHASDYFFRRQDHVIQPPADMKKHSPDLCIKTSQLIEILSDPNMSPDLPNLQGNISSVYKLYLEFMGSPYYQAISRQQGGLDLANKFMNPVLEHPSVKLNSPVISDSWNDMFSVLMLLVKLKKNGSSGSKKCRVKSHDNFSDHIKTCLEKTSDTIYKSNKSGEEFLDDIKDLKSIFSTFIEQLKSQSHFIHPSNYPIDVELFEEFFEKNRERICLEERKTRPVDALVSRLFDTIAVHHIDKYSDPCYEGYGIKFMENIKKINHLTYEERKNFVATIFGHGEVPMIANNQRRPVMLEGSQHNIIHSGIQAITGERPDTTGNRAIQPYPSSQVCSVSNVQDLSNMEISINSEDNTIAIGETVLKMNLGLALLVSGRYTNFNYVLEKGVLSGSNSLRLYKNEFTRQLHNVRCGEQTLAKKDPKLKAILALKETLSVSNDRQPLQFEAQGAQGFKQKFKALLSRSKKE